MHERTASGDRYRSGANIISLEDLSGEFGSKTGSEPSMGTPSWSNLAHTSAFMLTAGLVPRGTPTPAPIPTPSSPLSRPSRPTGSSPISGRVTDRGEAVSEAV